MNPVILKNINTHVTDTTHTGHTHHPDLRSGEILKEYFVYSREDTLYNLFCEQEMSNKRKIKLFCSIK